jgi:hypothetical protein
MEYKVIVSHSGHDLTTKINDLINEGWKPIGSHQSSVRHQQNRFRGQQHVDTLNDIEYSQTMVKEVEKDIIEVGVYYYKDENGNNVYDIEEMEREFYDKIKIFQNKFGGMI